MKHTTNIDFLFDIQYPDQARILSSEDQERLEESIIGYPRKITLAQISSQEMSQSDIDRITQNKEAERLTPSQALVEYNKIKKLANDLRNLLRSRVQKSGGLDMPIDFHKTPELAIAVSKLFKGSNTKVTYDMFLTAVQYLEQLNQITAEALSI